MKEKKIFITTPAGEAIFPYLHTPDNGFDQNGDGKYSVSLLMDPEVPTHAKLIEQIENIGRTKVGDDAHLPIRDEKDRDGDITGKKLVKFSSKYKPKLLDIHKKPLADDDTVIGRGSIIRIAAKVNVYKNVAGKSGVNLYLNVVQVIELAEPFFGFIDDEPEEEALFEDVSSPTEVQTSLDIEGEIPF